MGREDVDWIHMALVVGSCERFNEPSGSVNFRGFLVWLNDY
jgi:hypothetical protein